MDQLSRVKMLSPIHEQIGQASPFFAPKFWWPLTDDAGATQAVNVAQGGGYPLGLHRVGEAALTFGDNGPGVGDGTGVKFSPSGSSTGQFLLGSVPALDWSSYTVECWVNPGASLPGWANQQILGVKVGAGAILVALYLANGVPVWLDDTTSITAGASIEDGGWHHIAVRRTSVTNEVTLYVDGALAGTATSSYAVVPTQVTVGAVGGTMGAGWFQGNIGEVALYNQQLAAGNMQTHADATNGYSGDTTDARAARWLSRAGVSSADRTFDVGQTTVGTYPQNGKDVVSACQDMATTEGGGSVFWFRWDGQARFTNRRYRDSTTPVLILDASIPALLDPDVWDPAFDETTLVNTSTVSRSAESGTLSTQTYTDAVSFGVYGEADDGGVTTYTLSDQDALNLAQAHVAGNAYPQFRLNQLAVNFHAATTSLYAALGVVEIGSRIRIINVPPAAAPLGTLDLFVEGWTEYPHPNTYRVVFDTSTADNPPRGMWGSFRWQADGQTLNTTLANPATTTVIIDTASPKPTLTSSGGSYPLDIQIGEEVITLNNAPAGSTSPQTFTGVTRGAYGTPVAYQPAGSVVQLYPATAWAL
jgi:hypothetical protein